DCTALPFKLTINLMLKITSLRKKWLYVRKN
ncbi:MAG: hypothetical protein ACI89T_002542, partial [Cognaticolwellia sp.]